MTSGLQIRLSGNHPSIDIATIAPTNLPGGVGFLLRFDASSSR